MRAAVERVWGWLTVPPPLREESQTRRATLLLRLLRFVLISIPCIFVVSLLDKNNTLASNIAVYVPLTCALLGVVAVVRRGHLELAGWLISITIWVFVAGSTVLFGGIMANTAVPFVIAVMVAGAALGARQALFFAVLSAVASGVVAWIELTGRLPAPLLPISLFNAWTSITVTFVLAAVLHNLAIRSLDEALLDASRALARLRETQHENETRGLHGAALARLAEQALLASDPRSYCVAAAEVAASLLSVDFVFLIEMTTDGHATLVDLKGGGTSAGRVSVEGTALARVPASVLRLDASDVRALVERLGVGPVTDGLLAPVRGRSNAHGYLGVATELSRVFSREEEQFLATLASVVGTLIERHLAADRAQRAQKLEVIGRLAGGVAHDFNNLLTVIMGTSDALRHEMGQARRSALVDDLDHVTDRARLLTRQLLAVSRKQVVTMTRLDLGAQVRESFPMMRRLVGDEFVLDMIVPETPVFIDGDRGSVDQIVLNLLVNARDASPGGGVIEIAVEATPSGGAVLRVRDEGVGMDEVTQRSIFQPFFTTKDQGTGLGLATVADIVRRHGARIDVQSQLGRGTSFWVTYPKAGADADAARVGESRVRCSGRVLLAEDHPLVRASTAHMLRSVGFDVVTVGSGREALERLLKDRKFVLLVTDVSMPDSGGRQLVEELGREGLSMPVLFISGYVDDVPTSPMGHSRFLSKPFTVDELGLAARACITEV